MGESTCIFCRIGAGEIPAQFLHQDDTVMAFRDISPKAPTHVLVVPREHILSLAHITGDHGPLLGHMIEVLNQVASAEGLSGRGYRVIANIGADSGSEVDHLHLHLMGGRRLGSMG
ncbi:MAG: histidine triad nucleotide-binding protein [Dehalococcoidia bacterium]|nr:histidine triad nucleotide-binding protein [Dehalococcoidia bacterium]